MAHLITGAKGQAHITPKSDSVWHRGLMGVESCILDFGEKLAPALVPSQPTNIRILDGCGMMQGRFFEIEEGSYDTVAIPNGAQGYNRIDIVCAKITQNENGTQSFSWQVVQGTQTTGAPQPPTVSEGSLDDGDAFALMPIASVKLNGVNIVAVETVATISTAGEHISLDTSATKGVDKELTDALTSLGWLAEVFSGGKLLLKKLLKKLVNSSDIVIEGHKVFNKNLSIGGGTYKEFDTTITKEGYKPIAIAGFGPYNDGGSGSSYVTAVAVYIRPNADNSCSLGVMLRNPTTNAVSNISYSVYITWQKI